MLATAARGQHASVMRDLVVPMVVGRERRTAATRAPARRKARPTGGGAASRKVSAGGGGEVTSITAEFGEAPAHAQRFWTRVLALLSK